MANSDKNIATYREIVGSMKRIYCNGNFKEPAKALEKSFKK
jgi:hypothetical protein